MLWVDCYLSDLTVAMIAIFDFLDSARLRRESQSMFKEGADRLGYPWEGQ
jgi:hypothetical protein